MMSHFAYLKMFRLKTDLKLLFFVYKLLPLFSAVDSINAQKAGILIEPNSSFLNPEFPELVDMETRYDKSSFV